MERAELLCALFVDAHEDGDLDEDELLLLAASVEFVMPVGAVFYRPRFCRDSTCLPWMTTCAWNTLDSHEHSLFP